MRSIGVKRLCANAVRRNVSSRLGPFAHSVGLSRDRCVKHLLHQPGLASLHGSGKSTGETELGAVAVDTVGRVQVLDDHDLEAGGATLAGSNDGPGEEEFPDLYGVVSKEFHEE